MGTEPVLGLDRDWIRLDQRKPGGGRHVDLLAGAVQLLAIARAESQADVDHEHFFHHSSVGTERCAVRAAFSGEM